MHCLNLNPLIKDNLLGETKAIVVTWGMLLHITYLLTDVTNDVKITCLKARLF